MNEVLPPTSETLGPPNPCYPVHSHLSTPVAEVARGPSTCSSLKVWHICNALTLSVVLFEIRHQLGIEFADFKRRMTFKVTCVFLIS
jgi:hypothetical protein